MPASRFPKASAIRGFAQVPDLETFAKSERERKILEMLSRLRLAGQNFFCPAGTPKDRVQILQDAMRKTFGDPDFTKEYLKNSGEDPGRREPRGSR
jgi:hypothetical protein